MTKRKVYVVEWLGENGQRFESFRDVAANSEDPPDQQTIVDGRKEALAYIDALLDEDTDVKNVTLIVGVEKPIKIATKRKISIGR